MHIGISGVSFNHSNLSKVEKQNKSNYTSSPVLNSFEYSKNSANALKLNGLNFARSVKFTGALLGAFDDLNNAMRTCKTDSSQGEEVGSVANINKLLYDFAGEFKQDNDAIKTTVKVGDKVVQGEKLPVYARTQIKSIGPREDNNKQDLLFEMAVRQPANDIRGRSKELSQLVDIQITPTDYLGNGTKEQVYVLNTKGNIMPVVEDGQDVLLTNAGKISKRNASRGTVEVSAQQTGNEYHPFVAETQQVRERNPLPSIGEGTEIVIGMENGRFENEIKDSIKTFVEKVQSGEIVLDQFVAQPNAKNTQLVMLAAGYGSRAEYTNASSSAIFHNKENGAQSTKGVFRTATGLTPMETTFITLHNAGLLDCSKDALEIGKNIKFYLNKDINRGNGGYTVGLEKAMARPDRKSIMIFPNDSMSRMTNAITEAKKVMDEGHAAIAMIAKEVPAESCIKTFGIMKLGENNEILEFAEKPAVIPEGYEKDGKCLTNTFQFAVSNEALEVMDMVEPYFSKSSKSKETRDWSKHFIPIIKTLTQEDDNDVIREKLGKVFGEGAEPLPDTIIKVAKTLLKDQKLIAIPTDEPWADCGTLNQLYQTTMQIVSGAFQLEDFERRHAQDCVNTKTGLIASSKDQLERISRKYKTEGQVMVVPQAKKITKQSVADIPVTINERK